MVVVVLVVVVIVDVVFDVLVVLNVDIVVQATSKVDMRLLGMEVDFGWGGGGRWWVVCKPIFMSNLTQLSQLRLC